MVDNSWILTIPFRNRLTTSKILLYLIIVPKQSDPIYNDLTDGQYNILFFYKYFDHEACVGGVAKINLCNSYTNVFSWSVCVNMFKRPHGIIVCAINVHSLNNIEYLFW